MHEQMSESLKTLREQKPLIHHITNDVVKNFTANGTLAIGASPVMTSEPREAADMVAHAGALVINTGTLTERTVEAMFASGKAANQRGIPVVLDPVGYGTTPYRNETIRALLQEIHVSVVRANAAEIAALCGQTWEQKGTDAGMGDVNLGMLAHQFVEHYNTTVAITGQQDVISDGVQTVFVSNGHPWLTLVIGSGCLATGVVACFHAVMEDSLSAAVAGLCAIGVSSEHAVQDAQGPGSLRWRLMDAMYQLSARDLRASARLHMKGVLE